MERIEHSSRGNKLQVPHLRSVQALVCALLMNWCGDTQRDTQQEPSVKIYVIEPGDSLSVIAQKHGISLQELLKSNNISSGTIIHPGQTLVIPPVDKENTTQPKTELSEAEWEQKVLDNLENGVPLETNISTYDLRIKFTPGEDNNLPLLISAFDKYVDEKNLTEKYSEEFLRDCLVYILCTAKHETANYKTLKEKTDGKKYNPPNSVATMLGNEEWEGPIYIGRGFVQVTGENNYQNWSRKMFGHPNFLRKYRTIILENPVIAADITVRGMMEGSFTGKWLPDFMHDGRLNMHSARKVVNGSDRAHTIENYAPHYEWVLSLLKR